MPEGPPRRGRKLAVVVSVVLALSLLGNLLLARGSLQAFAALQFARIFPLGYSSSSLPGPGEPAAIAADSLVFYGDSRAYHWGNAHAPTAVTSTNLAHGGVTSAQLLLQLRTLPPAHSRWALVQIGINDLHPAGALEGYRTLILANLRGNLPEIARLLLERSDRVILTTIIPPGHVPLQRRLLWDPHTLEYVTQTNALIRRMAATDARIVLLDAATLLQGPDGYLDESYRDADFFLHLNARAYNLLNQHLAQLVSQRNR